MASPNAAGNNNLVSTSAVNANDVYAVGYSYTAGGYDQTLLEHYDGTSWSIMPTSNGPFHTDLNGVVAISTNDVWIVGGNTTNAQGTNAKAFALHWDGSTMTGYTLQPFSGSLFSVLFGVTAISSNDVWAVGAYWSAGYLPLAYHWNGTVWSPVFINGPSGTSNRLFAVSAYSSTDIWAVGRTQPQGFTVAQSYATHLSGGIWSTVLTANTNGPNLIRGVNALEAGHAVGVGYGNFVSGVSPRQSQAWDLVTTAGATSPITVLGNGMGTGDNILLGVGRSGSALQAVGYKSSTPTAPSQTLVIPATWDPAGRTLTWAAPGPSASPGAIDNVLYSTTPLSPYVFWATGYTYDTTLLQTLTELYCALRFSVTGPAPTYAGEAFSLTVTAQNPNSTTASSYRGTVHFTSSDPNAVLPADYMFTPADAGMHVFNGVVLKSNGSQTIAASDTVTSFVTGSATFTVVCRGACQGPAGVPGVRDANPGPAGIPGLRDANQSGAAGPPPRLPKLGSGVHSGDVPSGVRLATAMEAVSIAGDAAPAAAAAPVVAAPAAAAEVARIPVSEAAQVLNAVGSDMLSVSRTPAINIENSPGYPQLVLIPLAIVSLALLVVRRRNTRRLIGHARP